MEKTQLKFVCGRLSGSDHVTCNLYWLGSSVAIRIYGIAKYYVTDKQVYWRKILITLYLCMALYQNVLKNWTRRQILGAELTGPL